MAWRVSLSVSTSLTFFTASAFGQSSPTTADDPKPDSTGASAQPAPQPTKDRYQDGIVIWQTPEDARVPLLMRFNLNTQVRYLNTTDSTDTFTDHLGVVREVQKRNDITVNRTMFILGGYIFDEGCVTAAPFGLPPAPHQLS